MELLQAINTRRSARSYAAAAVPLGLIEAMLEQAASAPSACNRRGWRCILVQRREDMEWLYRQGGSAVFQGSGQALLVCYESQTENSEWGDNIQSAAAFIAYFQLIAHSNGIGSCWICHLPPKNEVSKHFDIPSAFTPVAAVIFGLYLDEQSFPVKSGDNPGLLSIDRWSFDAGGEIPPAQLRTIFRKLYYALPFRSCLRGWAGRYEKKFDE